MRNWFRFRQFGISWVWCCSAAVLLALIVFDVAVADVILPGHCYAHAAKSEEICADTQAPADAGLPQLAPLTQVEPDNDCCDERGCLSCSSTMLISAGMAVPEPQSAKLSFRSPVLANSTSPPHLFYHPPLANSRFAR